MAILPVWIISPFCQILSCDVVLPNERHIKKHKDKTFQMFLISFKDTIKK